MDENKIIETQDASPEKRNKKSKKHREPAVPLTEPALPLLLCLVCFVISLLTLIIDRFIYPFGNELLAPIIISAIALIFPSYLAIMVSSDNKSAAKKLSELGCKRIKSDHIFFLLFTSLFIMSTSLMLNLALGGAEEASQGITLFGTFIAGENDFSTSYPYLILTYALIPAISEELLFRGVIFSRLSKTSFLFSATVSTLLYSLFVFSLGGIRTSVFIGIMMVFVFYTTDSIFGCMIVHFIYNLYRLFLEANVCAYFMSQSNRLLLFITVSLALLISTILFSSECLRIYRKRASDIKNKLQKSAGRSESVRSVISSIRSALAYIPNLIFTIIIVVIFTATVIINYITL